MNAFKLRHSLLLVGLLTLTGPVVSVASGGGGFDENAGAQPKIDKLYELGRSYFKAKQADGNKLKYCIKSETGLKKLSRKSVRPFKKQLKSQFIESLYSCVNPQDRIFDVIAEDRRDAVLYYLNKRYKLRLKDG